MVWGKWIHISVSRPGGGDGDVDTRSLLKVLHCTVSFFRVEVYELCWLDSFTIHHNMKFHLSSSFLFYISYFFTQYKTYGCNTVLKALAISRVRSKITYFFSDSFYHCCVVEYKLGWSEKIHQESMKVCDLAHCVTFLWCRNSGGEAFVRSFVSRYPQGFCAPYFFRSESPGYTSVISLLHSPPSQLEDTIGIDEGALRTCLCV